MTSLKDPPRLFDEASGLSERERSVLSAGRDVHPSAEQLQRLDGRLSALIAPVVGAAAGSGAAAGGGAAAGHAIHAGGLGIGAAVKWVLGGAALGGAVALGAVHVDDQWSAPKGPLQPVVQTAVPLAAQAAKSATHGGVVATETARVDNAGGSSAARSDTAARRAAPAASVRPGGAASASTGSREAEVALLGQAQRALQSGQAQSALALTEQHRRMPNTVLSQERERIAIEALLDVGQRDAARARAEAFRRSYPTSSYLLRIQSLFGGKEKNDTELHK